MEGNRLEGSKVTVPVTRTSPMARSEARVWRQDDGLTQDHSKGDQGGRIDWSLGGNGGNHQHLQGTLCSLKALISPFYRWGI